MSDPVKATRAYHSPRRQEQAAATRRDVLVAAQRLFERDGYAATTMAAISAEAGVAAKTVYLAFQTKAGVLRGLWDVLLKGADDTVPVAGQQWFQELADEPDPRRRLALNARNSRVVKGRAATLMAVIRAAAAADDDLAGLWETIQTEFHDNQRSVVALLDAGGHLRRGLAPDRAADELWTLNHPDVWSLLVGRLGWTPAEYEEWLADISCARLLG